MVPGCVKRIQGLTCRYSWLQFIYGDRQSIPRVNIQEVRHSEHHDHTAHSNLLLPPTSHTKTHNRRDGQNGASEPVPTVTSSVEAVVDQEDDFSNSRYRPLPHDSDETHPSTMRSLV